MCYTVDYAEAKLGSNGCIHRGGDGKHWRPGYHECDLYRMCPDFLLRVGGREALERNKFYREHILLRVGGREALAAQLKK